MSNDTRTYTISYDQDLGPVLKNFARDTEQASRAIDGYGQTVRRTAEAQARSGDTYGTALRPTEQRIRETQARDERAHAPRGDELSLPSAGNTFLVVSLLNQLIHAFPPIRAIEDGITSVTALTGFFTIVKKYFEDPGFLKLSTKDIQSAVTTALDFMDTVLTPLSSFAGVASLAGSKLLSSSAAVPLLTSIGAIGTAAASPLLAASVGVAGLLYIAKRISDKEKARQREFAALAEERRRTAPQHTMRKLEDYALGRENSLYTAYETLRMSNQSIVNLTGKDVDDLLKGLQDLDPKAVESAGAREAAAEYANQLRPVDVMFETLAVHAGELISKFVGQREELHRSTQATEAQARATTELAAATTAQRRATEHAVKVEAAHNQHLRTTTRQTRAASTQIFHTTERLEDFTGALATTNRGLDVHDDHVAAVTEAYRALSEQIGATVGAVLSGEVSFKEAWESLGRGVLETVRNIGRQLVDSLLRDVRDLGRGLPDVIFGPFGGARGSIGFGGSLGFLPSFLAGGSPGGLPAGFPTFPTFPTGGGFSFGGFPVGGGSQLWNAGAATVARYLPFTAPTLASYGFAVSPIGLGIGSGGVAPGLNAGALGVTPRYAAPVPGVNAPPAAGFGPFSPAALGALGGLGGAYGGTALLGALGYQPGLASTIGGFAGGIAGSLATPALTALLAPALGPLAPLAPVLGPLFGTFFGTTLGGLFGFQPTRIDSEKRAIRAFFREEVPGYDYQRKESRNVTGLHQARAAGLDVGPAYLAASLPYVLAADNGGVGTVQRFHNIGVSGLGRSGASLDQARAAALRTAQRTGTHTTAGAIAALNRSLAGGFDRKSDPFSVDEVLWGVRKSRGESRPTRDPVRLRNVVAGIIDIQTEFASFVDSSRLAADILADETEQALTAAGRDAGQYADVLDRIRDGSTHAAEALREIGGIDIAGEGSFTEALAAIGRGVRERIGKVGRGPLDSLLISVRELRHRLSDVIFGKLRGAVGSFKHSIGGSFFAFFFLTVPIFPSSGTPSRI